MAHKKQGRIKGSASQQSYNSQMRWERNKRRRIEKEARRQEYCAVVQRQSMDAYGNQVRARDVSRRVRRLKAA